MLAALTNKEEQMNRHQATEEIQAVPLRIDPSTILLTDIGLASALLSEHIGSVTTKWFNKQAIADYRDAIDSQLVQIKTLLAADPHTRRAVMVGPLGACWLSTQYLSLKTGGYHAIAYYRSLDQDHTMVDAALQLVLGNVITNKQVKELTIFAGSSHNYL